MAFTQVENNAGVHGLEQKGFSWTDSCWISLIQNASQLCGPWQKVYARRPARQPPDYIDLGQRPWSLPQSAVDKGVDGIRRVLSDAVLAYPRWSENLVDGEKSLEGAGS